MTELECKQIFAMLSEYLDRDLPAEMCERISGHIEGCPPCVEFVRSLEKTVHLCRQVANQDKPLPLDADAMERLKAALRVQ